MPTPPGLLLASALALLAAPSPVHLAYRPGVPLIEAVWRDGARVP